MPLDPSIPLSVKPIQLPDPLEMFSAIEQVKGQREAAELRRLAAEETRRKAKQQAQIAQAYRQAITKDPTTGRPTVDFPKMMTLVPDEALPDILEALHSQEANQLDVETKTLALNATRNKVLGGAGQAVLAGKGAPSLWQSRLQDLRRLKVIDEPTYQLYSQITDPEEILQAAQSWVQNAGGEAAKPELVERVNAQGHTEKVWVIPKVGESYVQPPSSTSAGFTLAPGAVRYDPTGKIIAESPVAPPTMAGFTLGPGSTRFGPGGEVIASVAPTAQGGRPVTSGDAGKIADLDTSRDDLAVLSTAMSSAGATGTAAKIGASMPAWVTDVTGWGTEAKSKQALIDRVKQVIGKALEGGVLRKEDEVKYEKILPTIADPPSLVVSKLRGLDSAIAARRQTQLEALADAGYDTSRFEARSTRPPLGTPPPAAARKVGDILTVKGQKVRITKLLPGGKYEAVAVP